MNKRILILVDQASRDGVSQLLIAEYLRRNGAKVYLANQHTFIAMFERCQPHVTYVSWLVGGPLMHFLLRNHHRSRIALIDQEGGRMGKEPFFRHFDVFGDGLKVQVARIAAKIFVWGPIHARWLHEMGVGGEGVVTVVGSPRFDPYLALEPADGRKHLGVTMRADAITSATVNLMSAIHFYSQFDGRQGFSIAYPIEAQYEDKMWHVFAAHRYLFKTATGFASRSTAPIVFRPGPWEQLRQYDFVPARIPRATVAVRTAQHDYVRNAFALLEETSSMGLEGLLAGVPVVSVQAMIPRLAERLSGTGGGLHETAYLSLYWRPTTLDEAIDLLLKAERGELAATPRPADLDAYLRDYHCWPRQRPSSFLIGDALLELLDRPTLEFGGHDAGSAGRSVASVPAEATDGKITDVAGMTHTYGKEWIFRRVPGTVALLTLKCFVADLLSPHRQVWFRYHYYRWIYPHQAKVRALFEVLWRRHPQPYARLAADRPPQAG